MRLTGLSAGLAMLTLTGCSQSAGDQDTREALTSALVAAASSGVPIDLATVVPGGWTRVLFLCPYGNADDVNEELGFTWGDYPGADNSEGLATFAFASASEVVTWATVGRNLGGPCSGAASLISSRKASAVFRLVKTDVTADGRPFYSLEPQR